MLIFYSSEHPFLTTVLFSAHLQTTLKYQAWNQIFSKLKLRLGVGHRREKERGNSYNRPHYDLLYLKYL
jgi:hypothetical protein